MRPTMALARFHASAGGAIALRAAVPIGGVVTVAIGLTQYPGKTLAWMVTSIAEGQPVAAAVLLVVSLSLAGWGAARLSGDGAGWLRHLPASATARRRGAVLGLAWVQLPVVLATAAAAISEGHVLRAAGAVVASIAVAEPSAPVLRRGLIAGPALAAAWLASTGGAPALLAAVALVAAADAVAGPMAIREHARERAPIPASSFFRRVALRALGPGAAGAAVPALLPIGAAALAVANNDQPAPIEARAVRLGAVLAATLTTATLAERLAARRPPWPWERALPVPTRDRIVVDAAILGVAACVPVAVAALVDPWAAAVSLGAVPFLALRAVAAMRRDAASRTLAAGPVLIEGGLAALVVALLPWMALVLLAATPWALRAAVRAERGRSVSRWIALHHDATGDSESWSGR